MLIGDVRPTTLDGVKRLATQLRKGQGVKHTVALDMAAQAANCSNFRNAKRILPQRAEKDAHPYILLSIYWQDEKQGYVSGRETLKIELSRPIFDICGRHALKKVRGFGTLRMVADDHFVADSIAPRQEYARERLCTAERSIRFMERTGLRPPRSVREAHPEALSRLPSQDHSTVWIDPASSQFILIDEPYGGAPDEEERAAWATRTGWKVVKTAWPGMYSPYDCDLYVVTDARSGYDLDALVAKIDAMPAPLLVENWPGESSPSWDTFVSPLAKTPQDVSRARCRGTVYPMDSATSVPCSYKRGSTRRRPIGELGVAGHVEAGSIIKAVLMSHDLPNGVWRRLSSLRSTLEDWMDLEIGQGQLDRREFFKVYYGKVIANQGHGEKAKSRMGIVEMLRELKAQLLRTYSNCAPLRHQVHRIEMAISLFEK